MAESNAQSYATWATNSIIECDESMARPTGGLCENLPKILGTRLAASMGTVGAIRAV